MTTPLLSVRNLQVNFRLDKNTQVGGNVSTSGAYYTDVRDSFVDGTLSVLNNLNGSVVCGGAVQGKSTFAGNLVGVQLGGRQVDQLVNLGLQGVALHVRDDA